MSIERNEALANGRAAAAVLAAAAGFFMLGLLALAGDASRAVARLLTLYPPTGPLSGVTLVAIVFWLLLWSILGGHWRRRNVAMRKVNAAAFLLLAAGVLLTFPPFMDLLQGK